MKFKEKLKIHWLAIKFEAKERLIDFGLFMIPVFIAVGGVMMAVKFWLWVLF